MAMLGRLEVLGPRLTGLRLLSNSVTSSKSESLAVSHPMTMQPYKNVKPKEDDGGLLPDGRPYTEWRGKKYRIGLQSELQEGVMDKMETWIEEGKWCPLNQRPYYRFVWRRDDRIQRNKMWQVYSEINEHIPITWRYPHDRYIKKPLVVIATCIGLFIILNNLFHLILGDRLLLYKNKTRRVDRH